MVVPQLVDGTVAYRGYAEVEREPAADPVRPLVPNLVTFPSRNPQMKTAAYLVDQDDNTSRATIRLQGDTVTLLGEGVRTN